MASVADEISKQIKNQQDLIDFFDEKYPKCTAKMRCGDCLFMRMKVYIQDKPVPLCLVLEQARKKWKE